MRRWTALLCLPLVGCLAGSDSDDGGTVDHSTSGVVSDGVYQIQSTGSGKCLDVAEGQTSSGAPVIQWLCHGQENQQWRLRRLDGELFEIKAVHSGKCLDVAGSNPQNGTAIQQWDCNGTRAQQWRLVQSGGSYELRPASASSSCMDVRGRSKADGAKVQEWRCTGKDNQKWSVTLKDDGGGGGPAGACPEGSLELRALMIIKDTDLASPAVHKSLSRKEIDEATTGFKTQAGAWISQISNGQLCFVGDVVVSPRALTTLHGGGCTGTTPWANDIQDDLAEFAPSGKYDSIFLYAHPGGDSDPNCGGGPSGASHDATFAYVIPRGEGAWADPKNDVYDGVIHEWMHGVIGFYEGKPGVGPVPSIDSAGTYGYEHDRELGWKVFLGDVLKRNVRYNGALIGLGEPAWRYGNIRDAASK